MLHLSLRGALPRLCYILAILAAISSFARAADDNISLLEEAAMKAAVERVAPSVVRIETLGGLETVGGVLVGTGPTTGLIVSNEGHIISSAFNFAQKPSQIIVYLADGTRLPAQQVARDNNRMLVLLKVPTDKLDATKQLPVPVAVPKSEMRVGQWAIAVGRVFEGNKPNVSVGIVSALNRVWGKAIQTDAKISPSNYGGPLVDVRGRVLGLLVPMSPQESGETAGAEWYDSGIGFAVPLEHINRVLDRLKSGEELQPGLLGVNLKGGDPYSSEPVIAASVPNSPAYEAGLKAGDKIVEIDGVKVTQQSELKHQIMPRYAGETVTVAVLRDKERLEKQLKLVDKVLPYVHPFLGILPMREGEGVTVRHVLADSPAAKAGMLNGDKIISLDGQPVASRLSLQEQVAALEPGKVYKVEFERSGKTETAEVKLATLPEAIPPELPAAHGAPVADETPAPRGKIAIKVPDAKNDCFAFVPESYQSSVPHGIVVLLHGGDKDVELIKAWQPMCEKHDFVLLVPKPAEAGKWQRADLDFVRKTIDDVLQNYNVDRSRIVAVGDEAGGGMAYFLAGQHRDLIRGVAALGAPLPPGMQVPANEPTFRLAIFTTTAEKAPPAIAAGIKKLREAKHPVTQHGVGETLRDLSAEELAELSRWIDSLDRS